MRKVMLAVVGLVGLVLLCGSGELLAQTDTTTNTPNTVDNTVDGDAMDTRLQGVPPLDTGGDKTGTTPAPTSGVGGSGMGGTAGTAGTDTAGSTGAVTSGAGQMAGGTGTGTEGGAQSVLQLQQEVAQLRQEVAQLRAQLDNVTANTGVGGSGQAGVAPSGSQAGATASSSTASSGTAQQGAVAGGTPPSTPLRAGTAQETGARGTEAPGTTGSGQAVVNAIYTGTVRSVSGGRLVLLDEHGTPFTVELGERTRVLRNGQRISAQDLQRGTRVRAVVDLLSGHNQATEVTTLPAS